MREVSVIRSQADCGRESLRVHSQAEVQPKVTDGTKKPDAVVLNLCQILSADY